MPSYFYAVVPPEPILSRIEAFRARWGHPHHNVEPHITVKPPFQATGEFLAPARAACAGLAPFRARLGAPARFRNDVLFLSVESPGLHDLHRAVAGEEERAYVPHLTLAVTRFGIDADGLNRMEEEAHAELTAFPPFLVAALRCYQREAKDDRWETLCDLPLHPL